MIKEIELKDLPFQGLVSSFFKVSIRDISMGNHQRLGYECQPWRCTKTTQGLKEPWTATYYGFSYSKTRKLSKKQKEEFERLRCIQ